VNRRRIAWKHRRRHRRRCGCRYGFFARDSGPQTQLELRFGGAEERLVDLGLVGIQDDIRGGRVGVALKHDLLAGFELQDASELNMTY
jgi:hypothetical protein